MTWNPDTELLAQMLHLTLGLLFPLAGMVKGFPFLYGAVVILVIAIVKEFPFDIIVEKGTVREGFIDLSVYLAGIGIALLLVVL